VGFSAKTSKVSLDFLTSFRKYSNRLVLRCQTPRPGTDVSRTLEAIIRDKFKAAGLDNYLILLRVPRIHDL
jgi:hypothetical protein